MSDTSTDQQEPSMEEILASIRRIISEDGDEGREESGEEADGPEGEPAETTEDTAAAPEDDD